MGSDWVRRRENGVRWRIRASAHDELQRTLLPWRPDPDEALAFERVRRGRSFYVLPSEGGGLFVKRLAPQRYDLGLLYRILSGRVRGRREFRQAVRVHRRGVPVAEPLAFGERHRPFRSYESQLVYRRLPASGRTLAAWPVDTWPAAERRRVLDALASFAAELHERGVFHLDLTPLNVFLARAPDGELDLFAVDLETARLGRASSASLSLRSLAKMREKFRDLRPGEGQRFLDRYLAARPSLAVSREVLCARIGAPR